MGTSRKPGTALATRSDNATALATPDYLKGYTGRTGTEDITTDEINIPRLKLGQDMSKEVQGGDVARGDLFLNINGEVVNEAGEKLPFVIIKRYREIILWRPQKDGGGILDRAVLQPNGKFKWLNGPATYKVKIEGKVAVEWTTGVYVEDLTVEGQNDEKISILDWGSEIPGDKESGKAATEHHNYIVVLPTRDCMVSALSLSRTAAPRAKDFNADLKMSSMPLQARLFTVESVDDNRDGNDFKNYKFRKNAVAIEGVTSENPSFVNAALYARFADMAKAFEGKAVTVDQTDGGDAEDKDDRA
jgi:hypothetical protein